MPAQYILPIVLMALLGGYSLWMVRRRKAGTGPAFRLFFERTGYRYAGMEGATIEQQVAHGESLAANYGRGGQQTHMVRDFHGVPIHWQNATTVNKSGGWSMSCTWSMPLAQPARSLVQIADKSLSGVGKAVKEAFSNMERHWKPEYPTRVDSGDPELDARFQFYCHDTAAVQRVALAPGVKELLLGCAEVDLTVAPQQVVFSDPMQKNVRAGMGGTIGMMATGGNMERHMELSIPVHDRIAELLATVARAA